LAGSSSVVTRVHDRGLTRADVAGDQGVAAVALQRPHQVVERAPVANLEAGQPESGVRAFLQQLVPAHADIASAEAYRLLEVGDRERAEAGFRDALAERSDHPAALLGLAGVLLDKEELDDALALLERIPPQAPEMLEAKALRGRIRFRREAPLMLTSAEALARLNNSPQDPQLLYALGVRAAARADYSEALERFLTLTEHSRMFGDDAGRKAMLSIFDILGTEHALVLEYRPRLSAALH